MQILEGKSYRLQFPWIGVVNRSQQDINKSVDMIAARRRERDFFANTPEYKHLAHRMGSEHLAKSLSKVGLSSLMENICYVVRSLTSFLCICSIWNLLSNQGSQLSLTLLVSSLQVLFLFFFLIYLTIHVDNDFHKLSLSGLQ